MGEDEPVVRRLPLMTAPGLNLFWNAYGDPLHSGVVNSCTDGSIDRPDSDDGTLWEEGFEPPLPAQQHVRNIMNDLFSPFMNCVQPPFQACTAPTKEGNLRDVQVSTRQKQASIDATINHNATTLATVNVNDVLCGRGNSISRHVGNVKFRDLIDAHKDRYAMLTRKEKMIVAQHIVDLIVHHTDPPGRFVRRDAATGLWLDIGISRSLEKTSQALRDKSAGGKTTPDSFSIGTVPSFDESIPNAVVLLDEKRIEKATFEEFSRAATFKMKNHRRDPVGPSQYSVLERSHEGIRDQQTVSLLAPQANRKKPSIVPTFCSQLDRHSDRPTNETLASSFVGLPCDHSTEPGLIRNVDFSMLPPMYSDVTKRAIAPAFTKCQQHVSAEEGSFVSEHFKGWQQQSAPFNNCNGVKYLCNQDLCQQDNSQPSHQELFPDQYQKLAVIGYQAGRGTIGIRSPTEMTQSFAGGRRRQDSLTHPLTMIVALDSSVENMDGIVAFSTAAFLQLDESF
jgi:hypothetical protein